MNVFIESWGYVGYLIFVDVGVKINGAYHSEVFGVPDSEATACHV